MLKRLALVLLLAAASLASHASFHLWQMTELYSNADGTVQFLEFTSLTGGQEFLSGHTLTATSGSATHTYNFTTDLPGDTDGKRFLVGTQGFAALGIVAPDYVVPNGFFFQGGGTINFASADIWTHGSLLNADVTLSLTRTGATGVNSPRNFAGQTGTIKAPTTTPSAAFNFQALWWNDPPLSESGWGLNIAHQGDILFVTWFTYDTDGSQMWLVMSNAAKTGTNRYEGAIFRTTGPAFNVPSWNPAQVSSPQVGTGTLAFSNADRGTFTYTIGPVTQTKNIVRQEFAAPVSICAASGTPNPDGNFQDLWWGGLAESGWGINITHQGDVLFATWFTYDATGRGQWIVMSAGRKTVAGTYTGDLFRTTGTAFSQPWNPASLTVPKVGTGTFTFADRDNGVFDYTVNGVTGRKAIMRQVYANPPSICR